MMSARYDRELAAEVNRIKSLRNAPCGDWQRAKYCLSDNNRRWLLDNHIESDLSDAAAILAVEDIDRYIAERRLGRKDHQSALAAVRSAIAAEVLATAQASVLTDAAIESIKSRPYELDEEDLLSFSPREYFDRAAYRESMASGRMRTHLDADV